ncbi:MAG: septum formation initiator family protein [Candidatus Gastranaerophilaceae bacterium]
MKTAVKNHSIPTDSLNTSRPKKIYGRRFYYSLLTIVLLILLVQIFIGAGLNIAKFISLNTKITKLKDMKKHAVTRNIYLKEELRKYKTGKGIEELARDKLRMAGKNEVLVIIKDKPNPPKS